MAERVIEILKNKYLLSFIRYEELQRIEDLEIPEDALLEAIFNSKFIYTASKILRKIWKMEENQNWSIRQKPFCKSSCLRTERNKSGWVLLWKRHQQVLPWLRRHRSAFWKIILVLAKEMHNRATHSLPRVCFVEGQLDNTLLSTMYIC